MNPLEQLRAWLDIPIEWESGAAVLATVDEAGRPNARYVLLRGLGEDGLRFFTNYESVKARELAHAPAAAMVFAWPERFRSARVRGAVQRLDAAGSDAYWATRPRGSQISAWASDQSRPTTREELERRVAEFEERFAGVDVPRPAHWGGYLLVPDEIEFWEGRPDRLHERTRFTRSPAGWDAVTLAP